MIATRWLSFHGGGITRGGVDYQKAIRKIWLYKNFRFVKGDVPAAFALLKGGKMQKFLCANLQEAMQCGENNCHIVFRWNTCHEFADFAGEQQFLRQALMREARRSEVEFAQRYEGVDFIGMNVRCGNDFVTNETPLSSYVKTDLEWYRSALRKVRAEKGDVPALIVSDGGVRQLRGLLSEPNVRMLDSSTAIADLLVLSHAKVLLGCGNSTFSAWASFLGEMDTYSSPRTPFAYKGMRSGRGGAQVVDVI